ncbi:hypothetical protein EU244_027555 [Rhodococcus qingshengii]|uniref:hypothetical protein n=1 Tax=Rhodococcus qingshengii TaxID=334542 RepID=UPI0010A5AF4D|nr:hypothetical protein [Rhodococcus qingshengii]THJ66366.1 hypothetical protein EU244_28075 [Rhodococcus qingshengii]
MRWNRGGKQRTTVIDVTGSLLTGRHAGGDAAHVWAAATSRIGLPAASEVLLEWWVGEVSAVAMVLTSPHTRTTPGRLTDRDCRQSIQSLELYALVVVHFDGDPVALATARGDPGSGQCEG